MKQILAVWINGFYMAASTTSAETLWIVARDDAVLDASEEVLRKGVTLGMPLRRALRLAPAVVSDESPVQCRELAQRVWDIAAAHTPLVETLDYHKGFVDLTGCLRKGETLRERAETIREGIRSATGLETRIGGGSCPLIAQTALRKPPNGIVLTADEELPFRASIPLSKCPSIPTPLVEQCDRLGIRTLGDVAHLPMARFLGIVGKNDGWAVYQTAKGKTTRRIHPNYPPRSLFVSQSFAPPTDQEPRLVALLQRLCRTSYRRLRGERRRPAEIALSLRFADGERRDGGSRFPRAELSELAISHRAGRLWGELWQGEEVERIALVCRELSGWDDEQGALWGNPDKERERKTAKAMEMTRARFGSRSLSILSDESAPHHLQPLRFAERIWESNGLCPVGTGW